MVNKPFWSPQNLRATTTLAGVRSL